MTDLDKDELDLLESFERGEWQPIPDKENEIKRHQTIAQATFEPEQSLNIRLSVKDLNALQKRALVEGVPYGTLVSSILHKYASGYLVDVAHAK
ncbi:MAG: antitoxin [Pseudomonadota bacterium]